MLGLEQGKSSDESPLPIWPQRNGAMDDSERALAKVDELPATELYDADLQICEPFAREPILPSN